MRVVFMGSDAIALPLLNYLAGQRAHGVEIVGVFTQPDRPTGRGMKLQANAIKQWALKGAIPVLQPLRCGATEAQWLTDNRVDLVLVMAYGQILRRDFIQRAPLGTLNFHASRLPRLRGASPLHTAIALGLPETAISLMRIVPALDAGPVADVEPVAIAVTDGIAELYRNAAEACVPLLARNLPVLRDHQLTFHAQDDSRATYCRILTKDDAALDFHATAEELANRVRAFQPWPGTRFPFADHEIKVLAAVAGMSAADIDPFAQVAPGTVLDPSAVAAVQLSAVADLPAANAALWVRCAHGVLAITRLQRPGGKPLPAAEFLRGWAIEPGTVLASRPMQPLESVR